MILQLVDTEMVRTHSEFWCYTLDMSEQPSVGTQLQYSYGLPQSVEACSVAARHDCSSGECGKMKRSVGSQHVLS